MSGFHCGQKVICIAAPWLALPRLPWECPRLQSVYVIRGIRPWLNGNGASLLLHEIRNYPVNGREPSFSTEFFRPVAERKTDISVFTALLNKRHDELVG